MMAGKYAFAFIFLVAVTNVPAQSVELWNGFTTDMTRRDVIILAREKLEVGNIDDTFFTGTLFINIADVNYYEQPPLTSSIWVTSVSNRYLKLYHDNVQLWNILFDFYDEKLFAVTVLWAAGTSDLLPLVKAEYGDPARTDRLSYHHSYYWKLPDKDFFLYDGVFCAIDRHTRDNWIEEQRRIEQREQEDEANAIEQSRKAAIEGIQF